MKAQCSDHGWNYSSRCMVCVEAVAANQASARADVRSISDDWLEKAAREGRLESIWVDAAVARKSNWEKNRIEALRIGNKERAEYWEGRRDGINEVLMLRDIAASTETKLSYGRSAAQAVPPKASTGCDRAEVVRAPTPG